MTVDTTVGIYGNDRKLDLLVGRSLLTRVSMRIRLMFSALTCSSCLRFLKLSYTTARARFMMAKAPGVQACQKLEGDRNLTTVSSHLRHFDLQSSLS